jgi:hypothetical protein
LLTWPTPYPAASDDMNDGPVFVLPLPKIGAKRLSACVKINGNCNGSLQHCPKSAAPERKLRKEFVISVAFSAFRSIDDLEARPTLVNGLPE